MNSSGEEEDEKLSGDRQSETKGHPEWDCLAGGIFGAATRIVIGLSARVFVHVGRWSVICREGRLKDKWTRCVQGIFGIIRDREWLDGWWVEVIIMGCGWIVKLDLNWIPMISLRNSRAHAKSLIKLEPRENHSYLATQLVVSTGGQWGFHMSSLRIDLLGKKVNKHWFFMFISAGASFIAVKEGGWGTLGNSGSCSTDNEKYSKKK